ncbi:signal transduction histidine kinase, LytS [Cellulomonas flavigena DSM 20109]|uniref:Signal transduction histidine kinase, LytS n=1 Tax=Cellulomonas flavigena (strain ATCC 482 / DSM 20109 / BCRC 11376 / JCM 18109 / NBRC 3775 / NCIMB 8073 / NRS 134) TaxID=446466 RepID=D5UKD1_CELFN|nr:hypothetical protein [Cellulomonas flavigena]ADG75792.1 signal transduction histidine kinase, LytS [Cellulomonas flavigena DSM 20109]
MPEDPRPDDARPADAPPPAADPGAPGAVTPDEAELARVAVPATVRRAPRYRAFLVAGALLGALVGLGVAAATAAGSALTADDGGVLPFLGGQNGVRAVLALSGALGGTLVGGVLALLADRRSTRRRRPAPPA